MNDKFKEKLKLNIAISEIKNEKMIAMKNHKFKFKNGIGLVACFILCFGVSVFAYNEINKKTLNINQEINKFERKYFNI